MFRIVALLVAGLGVAYLALDQLAARSDLAPGVLATKECGGGVAGEFESVVVYDDGRVETTGIVADPSVPHDTRASRGQVAALRKPLSSTRWKLLGASYGWGRADSVSCRISGGGKSVESVNGGGPGIIDEVDARLRDIEALAQPTATVVRKGGPDHGVLTIRVLGDGTVRLMEGYYDENRVIGTDKLSATDLRRLDAALGGGEWLGLEPRYGSPRPGKHTYTVYRNVADRVEYHDGSRRPRPVQEVLAVVDKYWRRLKEG